MILYILSLMAGFALGRWTNRRKVICPAGREDALRVGVDGFLTKPLQMAEFTATVKAALAG